MLLDKLYQIDIVYDLDETLHLQTIESFNIEDALRKTKKFLKDYKQNNAYVHQAKMFIGKEKILIKQKIIELINRRNNG